MNPRARNISYISIIAALTLLLFCNGCGDGDRPQSSTHSGTQQLYDLSDPNPLAQVEVVLNLLATDLSLEESDDRIVARFRIHSDQILSEALAKSALIAGLVVEKVDTDKQLLVIGSIAGAPASAIEVDIKKARAYINGTGSFEFEDGFRVVDLDSIEAP
jgi:hypothetical protein